MDDLNLILNAYGHDALSIDGMKTLMTPDKAVLEFVALALAPDALQNPPTRATILTLRSGSVWKSAFAEWAAAEQPSVGILRGGIPDFPTLQDQQGDIRTNFTPIDELLTQMDGRFIVIVPFDSPTFSYWIA